MNFTPNIWISTPCHLPFQWKYELATKTNMKAGRMPSVVFPSPVLLCSSWQIRFLFCWSLLNYKRMSRHRIQAATVKGCTRKKRKKSTAVLICKRLRPLNWWWKWKVVECILSPGPWSQCMSQQAWPDGTEGREEWAGSTARRSILAFRRTYIKWLRACLRPTGLAVTTVANASLGFSRDRSVGPSELRCESVRGEGSLGQIDEERRKEERKSFIYPAVYKTDTTRGLIVTEISKAAVCWVGWEVAAAAVWSITQPLVFSLKALEMPLGAGEKWSKVQNTSNMSPPLSPSQFVSPVSPLCLSSCTNSKNSFRHGGAKYASLGQEAWKHLLCLWMCVYLLSLGWKFDLHLARCITDKQELL